MESETVVLTPKPNFKPLKHENWESIYELVYNQMNIKARRVELKTKPDTPEFGDLQKCADFIHACVLGFDCVDAEALLKSDELYVDSFEIKDVKTLRGEHLSRAIEKIWEKQVCDSQTRIVIADTKIHILGTYSRIKMARTCLNLQSHTGVSRR